MAVKETINERAQRLKVIIDAYGVGVRAGVLTPCIADEIWFRELFGLDPVNKNITSDWESTDGIRRPITIKQEEEPAPIEEGANNE
jgi:hypothetical protein